MSGGSTLHESIHVGADILELVSSAMYADPLVLYRELAQNSADAIEDAVKSGLLKPADGKVTVSLDRTSRTVIFLDNGAGLANDLFEERMLSFGGSAKRNGNLRGFRGIGRLASIGFARSLRFRSRAHGDKFIYGAEWDGHAVSSFLKRDAVHSLNALAQGALKFSRTKALEEPEHFFEVTLVGVKRLSDDRLFDATRIGTYLEQIAPVPFHSSFSLGSEIRGCLSEKLELLELDLSINGSRLFRQYHDALDLKGDRAARIRSLEFVEIPAVDEGLAAVGWIGHHDYLGALRSGHPSRGLRVRNGNLQVGDGNILASVFPEERFNTWALGEFHIVDGRLKPNARRDAFEPSVHTDNLFNQLLPTGAAIARRCRNESRQRNADRRFDALETLTKLIEDASIRDKSSLGDAIRNLLLGDADAVIERARLSVAKGDELRRIEELEKRVIKLRKSRSSVRLSSRERAQFEVFTLIPTVGPPEVAALLLKALNSTKR